MLLNRDFKRGFVGTQANKLTKGMNRESELIDDVTHSSSHFMLNTFSVFFTNN